MNGAILLLGQFLDIPDRMLNFYSIILFYTFEDEQYSLVPEHQPRCAVEVGSETNRAQCSRKRQVWRDVSHC